MAGKKSRMDFMKQNIMHLMGGAHMAFGFIIIFLQIASAIVSWMYENNNLFEDHFKPGIWLGPPILILGIVCVVQHRLHREDLHKYIIVSSVVVLMIDVSFIAMKSRYSIHDPEMYTFVDCQSGKWPKGFFLDMSPHCNALRMNNSIGQIMLAFASADIIVILVGIMIAQWYDYTAIPSSARTDIDNRV